jgi:hypothetical protein
MAKRGVIVDRYGNVVETDDDVVPDGHAVRVSAMFMDAQQRMVAARARGRHDAFEIDDALAQKIFDARAAYKARIGAGMHRFRVVTELPGDVADGEQRDARTDAYLAMKRRLSNAWKR